MIDSVGGKDMQTGRGVYATVVAGFLGLSTCTSCLRSCRVAGLQGWRVGGLHGGVEF